VNRARLPGLLGASVAVAFLRGTLPLTRSIRHHLKYKLRVIEGNINKQDKDKSQLTDGPVFSMTGIHFCSVSVPDPRAHKFLGLQGPLVRGTDPHTSII
jgi:hypothetical protein